MTHEKENRVGFVLCWRGPRLHAVLACTPLLPACAAACVARAVFPEAGSCPAPGKRSKRWLAPTLAPILALVLVIAYFLSPTSALASCYPLNTPRATAWGTGYLPGGQVIPMDRGRVASANSLTFQVKAGFDERYRNGDWVPIHITLSNYGADFSGILSTSNPLGPVMQAAGFTSVPISTYQQPITVRHGTQQEITMYLPLYTFFGPVNIPVQLLDAHGKVLQSQSATLYSLNEEDVFVGVLTDQCPGTVILSAAKNLVSPSREILRCAQNDNGFSPLQALALPSESGSVKVQFLDVKTLPDIAKVLDNFNLIVLDNFSTSRLSHQQVTALGTWVNQGGALIEIGGAQWQRTLASLPTSLLPVSVYGMSSLFVNLNAVKDLPLDSPTNVILGEKNLPLPDTLQPSIIVSQATASPGAHTILSAGAMPLLVQAQHGQGNISFLAFDPTTPPILSWSGATSLWKGLLYRSLGERIVPSDDGPSPNIDIAYGLAKLQHALLPYASPTAWILVLVFIAYLLILGPLRWLILRFARDRRFKQRAWSWRIALSSILIFSLFNYGLALYQQGTSMFSNSLSIISLGEPGPYGSFAHSTSYIGIYVPFVSGNGNVHVNFPKSTLVQPFTDFVLDQQPATITTSSDGTDVNLPAVDLRALNAFQVEQDLPVKTGITSHLTLSHGELIGTVTNTLPTALSDVYILLANSIARLGTLNPGQTSNVVLALPVMLNAANALPTCGAAINQLTTSSGGLPPWYNQLFYHDINRSVSERQRHLSFLTYLLKSTQCNISLNAPATLIAWADQPLDAASTITLNGLHPRGLHETLLLAPLDLTYGPASLALPADGLSAQLVDAQAANIRRLSTISYALMKGQMTFEYTLPALAHISRLTLTQPADISTQSYTGPSGSLKAPTYLALYNWHTASWNAIALTPSASFSTTNINAYIGPGGRVLLQCVNEESDLGIIAFTKPVLTIISN
jgi:hypothetical protein